MSSHTLEIPLNPQTAQAYARATPEEQGKIQVLLELCARELTQKSPRALSEIMDEIGARAHERGLTPDMLEQLLKD